MTPTWSSLMLQVARLRILFTGFCWQGTSHHLASTLDLLAAFNSVTVWCQNYCYLAHQTTSCWEHSCHVIRRITGCERSVTCCVGAVTSIFLLLSFGCWEMIVYVSRCLMLCHCTIAGSLSEVVWCPWWCLLFFSLLLTIVHSSLGGVVFIRQYTAAYCCCLLTIHRMKTRRTVS